jgi:Flp pilus assembly pilin Flp
MRGYLRGFLRDESGQDLVEYSLLIAFVLLTCAALVSMDMEVVQTIWTSAADHLTYAATHHF